MLEKDRVRRDLVDLVGPERVSWDPEVLRAHECDWWSLARLRRLRGRLVPPLCVVFPETVEHVCSVLRYASGAKVPVVPFGGGSGVCGGVLPDAGSVVLDLRRGMGRFLDLDEISLVARVQAGLLGSELEAELNERGYTCGHFPQSIALSTVGGWVATRASGQFSTRYGSIEDRLVALEVVLPSGQVLATRRAPRSSTGPDLRNLFLGSEGTLGVVTEVTLGVFPLPACRAGTSFLFSDMQSGLEAIREILRAGWRPPVLRLYDRDETARHFPESGQGCLLLVLSEGPGELVQAEVSASREAASRRGAVEKGFGPVERWLAERNNVPGFETFLEKGFVLDTIEVAALWDRVSDLYHRVTASLRAVPGVVVASGHSSHSYTTGTCLYFTFAARPESPEGAEALYERCWSAAMRAALDCGGTISHHHGIGRVRRAWLREELGVGTTVLSRLKDALDPAGILNPGVLLPE